MSKNKKDKFRKGVKKENNSVSNNYYTKFKKVHLVASGPIVLCRATTIDGVTETYGWNSKSNRDLIKNNAVHDIEVIVEPSVPEGKGWDYIV